MFNNKIYHGIKENGCYAIVELYADETWMTRRTYIGTCSLSEVQEIASSLPLEEKNSKMAVIDMRTGRFY